MSAPLRFQPIPYQGSKRSLAPRICGLFPQGIETLYEPFAGSAAVTLYAATHDLAERFVIGDIHAPIIDLWKMIIYHPEELVDQYSRIWTDQFAIGPNHFNLIREKFNRTGDAVSFLYLVARCVKNAVRFNRQGRFTQSVDKRRNGVNPDRVAKTVITVSKLLRGRVSLFVGDFRECAASASRNDLVYMDPPYQGTTDGRDKRYAEGLDRDILIGALEDFATRDIRYLLSYDGRSGMRTYGAPLPDKLFSRRLALDAGRSAQATLAGRSEQTMESLYISPRFDMTRPGEKDRDASLLFA